MSWLPFLSLYVSLNNLALRQALLDLGFEDCYHMAAVFGENPRDGLMWIEAIKAKYEGEGKMYTKDDWDQLLGHCMVCISP